MTNEEIDKMECGRELDALIAREVMRLNVLKAPVACYHDQSGCGWMIDCLSPLHVADSNEFHPVYVRSKTDGGPYVEGYSVFALEVVPHYSTNYVDSLDLLSAWTGDYEVRRQNGQHRVELFQSSQEWGAWAPTLQLAICRTRLKSAHPEAR